VPIIHYLLELGHFPLFAGNKAQIAIIQGIFGERVITLYLEGYNVKYAKNRAFFLPFLILQIPEVAGRIRKEKSWLKAVIAEQGIDAVISDNRYGLHDTSVPCVMMTHQLRIQTGLGRMANDILQRLHEQLIKPFDSCWLVDVPTNPGLSGELAHPQRVNETCHYIGWLSQLQIVETFESKIDGLQGSFVLILLSGPEPQRMILEEMLWKQCLKDNQRKFVFVAGKATVVEPTNIPEHITWHAYIGPKELKTYLAGAEFVVCRSGYSTLMDLKLMNKQGFVVPTPGQTEQEYLARNAGYPSWTQDDVDLRMMVLPNAAPIERNEGRFELYKGAVDALLLRCRGGI
jgi:hypothetical protein